MQTPTLVLDTSRLVDFIERRKTQVSKGTIFELKFCIKKLDGLKLYSVELDLSWNFTFVEIKLNLSHNLILSPSQNDVRPVLPVLGYHTMSKTSTV